MKNNWLIIAAFLPALSFSQENSSGAHINTIASVGLAAGGDAAKPVFHVTSGVAYGRWFTGIGAGLDNYYLKSIPLFVNGKLNIGKKRSTFVYTSTGYNFSYNNRSDNDDFYVTTDRFIGGFYIDAGIGYRIHLSSWHRLLFSAGYSRKDISNKVGYTYPCLIPPCPEEIYRYHYTLGRIMTNISWEFGK